MDRPLSNNSLSFSTNCLPHDAWPGGRGHASVDDDSFFAGHHPVSLSTCDLNDSSDDVFADSTTPSDKVVYINLPHLRFHNGAKAKVLDGGGRIGREPGRAGLVAGDSVENLGDCEGVGGDQHRTQSSSAVEDFVRWTAPRLTEKNNGHNGNNARNVTDRSRDSTPNGGLDLRRQSSTSTLVGGEQGNNNNNSGTTATYSHHGSAESLSSSHSHASSRVNGHGSSSVTPIRRLVERNLLKNHQEFLAGQQRPETSSPATVSLGSYGGHDGTTSSSSSSSSPVSSGRVSAKSCSLCLHNFPLQLISRQEADSTPPPT